MLQVRKEAANALTGIGEAAAPEIVVEDLAGESSPDRGPKSTAADAFKSF